MAADKQQKIRVLVVEDHPLIRLGLTHSLAADPDLELCGEADNETDAFRLVETTRPDAAIVDLNLRSGNGLDLIKRIAAKHDRVRTVVSSMCEPHIYEARVIRAGAFAYMSKDRAIADLLACVKDAAASNTGDPPRKEVADPEDPATRLLTDRELEVFRHVGEGLSTREIAERLHRGVKTVETHKSRIKQKLGLKSANELVHEATRWVCQLANTKQDDRPSEQAA